MVAMATPVAWHLGYKIYNLRPHISKTQNFK